MIVANDLMALGAMHEMKAAGLVIPRDISIVGFDDINFAALSDPPLTTVCSPREEIGKKAIEALMATIKESNRSGEEVRVRTYLVTRGTTAPPLHHALEIKSQNLEGQPNGVGFRH